MGCGGIQLVKERASGWWCVRKWGWWCLLLQSCKHGETLENLLSQPPLGGQTDGVHDRVVPLEIALRGFVHDSV